MSTIFVRIPQTRLIKEELSSRVSLPCGNLSVVIFWWGFEDVDSHSVTRIVSKAEHIWVHQGVLNK